MDCEYGKGLVLASGRACCQYQFGVRSTLSWKYVRSSHDPTVAATVYDFSLYTFPFGWTGMTVVLSFSGKAAAGGSNGLESGTEQIFHQFKISCTVWYVQCNVADY